MQRIMDIMSNNALKPVFRPLFESIKDVLGVLVEDDDCLDVTATEATEMGVVVTEVNGI